jgi:hypothetical protein
MSEDKKWPVHGKHEDRKFSKGGVTSKQEKMLGRNLARVANQKRSGRGK